MPTIDPTTVTNAQELEQFAELAALELVDLIDGAPTMRSAAPYARALVVALEFSEAVALPGHHPDPSAFGNLARHIAQAVHNAQEQAR